MAHFRATIKGQRGGEASRLGGQDTGLEAKVNGWTAGVKILARYDEERGGDVFDIYATTGSSTIKIENRIGYVTGKGEFVSTEIKHAERPTVKARKVKVPKDFPVQPLKPGQEAKDKVTCGGCGLSWDDAIPTTWTPVPAGRCPFEYFHAEVVS